MPKPAARHPYLDFRVGTHPPFGLPWLRAWHCLSNKLGFQICLKAQQMYRNHNKCLKAVELCEVQPVRCTGAILLLSFVQWVTCFRDLLIIVFVLVANAHSLRIILWVVTDQMDRICCSVDYDCVDTCFMLFWWTEADNSVHAYIFRVAKSVTTLSDHIFNPLECKRSYSATTNNMKLVHWPLMGGLLHLVQRGGDCAGPQPARAPPRCTKC